MLFTLLHYQTLSANIAFPPPNIRDTSQVPLNHAAAASRKPLLFKLVDQAGFQNTNTAFPPLNLSQLNQPLHTASTTARHPPAPLVSVILGREIFFEDCLNYDSIKKLRWQKGHN